MFKMLLPLGMLLAAAPALANPAASGRAATTMANACMGDCLSVMMSRSGAQPDAARICQVRCQAAGQFYQAQARGQQRPAMPTPPQTRREGPILQAAMPAASHGVIFVSRAPSAGFGLITGERDRLAAHRVAEQNCRTNGAGCRMLLEFTSACGAVAHGIRRSQYAIVMTSNPTTWVVSSASGGHGPTREAAEAEAMADCRSRDPGATCRVVAATCNGR